VNVLLDTHVLLWWLGDDPSLSLAARSAISEPGNTVHLSAVVVWEIRIKQALGKLELPAEFRSVLDAQSFVPLPVTVEHAQAVADLASVHRDPFDRLLVAQATCEALCIVTRDPSIPLYGVPTISA
jgi:PIN domain nuclease of toxin-antitoxin system